MTRRPSADGVVVARVRPRSAASDAGLLRGDRLLAINGTPLRDLIDFRAEAGEETLHVDLERDGQRGSVTLQRRWGRDLGIELLPPRPGEISTCANKCVFCFIHQLPRGMRKSLYVKDDDYRLSFLHGNYITLTDLPEADLQRIIEQRLSPLYISVHATDPELRHALLGKPTIRGELLPRLERLAKAGITLHAQIVLCPGWNDGSHLERSVNELAVLHPQLATVAVVPVGLTRYRERLPELRPVTPAEARALTSVIEAWQSDFLNRLQNRFVYAADELYLLAGTEPPPARHYTGFPLLEDGVGLVRRFSDGFLRALRHLPPAVSPARRVSVVTGQMFAPRLEALLGRVSVDGLEVSVVAAPNEFFGGTISVAGLLTGQDILNALEGRPAGELVLVPGIALKDGEGVFLDDVTPGDLEDRLGVRVKAPAPTPRALLGALLAR